MNDILISAFKIHSKYVTFRLKRRKYTNRTNTNHIGNRTSPCLNLVKSHALSSRQPWLLKAASSFYFRIGFDVNTSVLYFLRQVSLNVWRKRRLEQYFDLLIVLNNCIWFMSMQELCNLLLVLLVNQKCYVGSHLVFVFVVQECFNWWSSCICICCARIGRNCGHLVFVFVVQELFASVVVHVRLPSPLQLWILHHDQLHSSVRVCPRPELQNYEKQNTGKLGDEIPPAWPPLLVYIVRIY